MITTVCVLYFASVVASAPTRAECHQAELDEQLMSAVVSTCVTTHEGFTLDCSKSRKRLIIIQWFANWHPVA